MVKRFSDFEESQSSINEGLLSSVVSFFKGVYDFYKSPNKLSKALDKAAGMLGMKSEKLDPTATKISSTIFLTMTDPEKKENFNISMTKLGDLPNGTAIFQIVATNNTEMVKALTGSNNIEDFTNSSVMAILDSKSVVKGKPVTMRILRNVMPGGKDYVTKTLLDSVVPMESVEKELAE